MKLAALALLVFASCNAGALQQSLFRPAVVISLPSEPSNLALADLNKDGRLDLIVASEEARTIDVMFGERGDLPFRLATGSAATGQAFRIPEGVDSPGDLVVGDVNSDGRLDLAWDFHDSYNVTLLLGQANGGFALAPNSPIVMRQGQLHIRMGSDSLISMATANSISPASTTPTTTFQSPLATARVDSLTRRARRLRLGQAHTRPRSATLTMTAGSTLSRTLPRPVLSAHSNWRTAAR